ncbi:MAG: hypothetical protein ABIO36_05900 [Pyrinomonadaceae bacterium]
MSSEFDVEKDRVNARGDTCTEACSTFSGVRMVDYAKHMYLKRTFKECAGLLTGRIDRERMRG